MIRVPHFAFLNRVDAGKSLDRALARYSALESRWRQHYSARLLARKGYACEPLYDPPNERRFTAARIALSEAIEASTRATARDTRWSNAMRRARRAARGRK